MSIGLPLKRVADNMHGLHVELTTKCNAWCPGCPRSNNGFGLKEGHKLIDLDPDHLLDFVSRMPKLRDILLCGNRGDPIAYNKINYLLENLYQQERMINVDIHTNGGLRSTNWWRDLARQRRNYDKFMQVFFSIDGLQDTNHIYRQGTDFNKIINNAKSFIDAGGIANWRFLIFKHNAHQIEEARTLSKEIGFSDFITETPYIPIEARNWQTGEHYILSADNDQEDDPDITKQSIVNANIFDIEHENNWVDVKECQHATLQHSGNYRNFISAEGIIYPCCYWEDERKETYNIETLDIITEFSNRMYRNTCLEVCGTTKIQNK